MATLIKVMFINPRHIIQTGVSTMPFIDVIGNLVEKGESVIGTRSINLSTVDLSSGVDATTTGTTLDSSGDDVISDDSDLTLDAGEVALVVPTLVTVGSVSDVRLSTSVANSGDNPDPVDYEFEDFEEVSEGGSAIVAGEVATFDADESPSGDFEEGDKKIEGNVVVVQLYEDDAGIGEASGSFDPLAVKVNAEGY